MNKKQERLVNDFILSELRLMDVSLLCSNKKDILHFIDLTNERRYTMKLTDTIFHVRKQLFAENFGGFGDIKYLKTLPKQMSSRTLKTDFTKSSTSLFTRLIDFEELILRNR
jgi:hypothetical protein